MTQKVEGVTYQGKPLWYPEGLAGIQEMYDAGEVWTAQDIREAVLTNAPGGHPVTPLYTSDKYEWLCVMRFAGVMSETIILFPRQFFDQKKGMTICDRAIALAGHANGGLFSLVMAGMRTRNLRFRKTA